MNRLKRGSRLPLIAVLAAMLIFIMAPALQAVPGKAALKAPNNPHFEQFIASGQYSRIPTADDGRILGYVPSPLALPVYESVTDTGIAQSESVLVGLPGTFDLRSTGDVSRVKDQSTSGSCWAFATFGSMESYLMANGESEQDFSENNLKNTSGFDIGPNSGGNGTMSTAYLSRWSGPVNELTDPFSPSSTISPTYPPVRHVQDVDFLPADIATIKQAIYDHGAVYTAFYYASSGFNDVSDSYYYGSAHSANHAVTIVGWNDNFSASNFNGTPAGNGAWIIKNSWGTSWGAGGYFYLSYYDKTALAENVAFHNAESTANYDKEYSYDPLGWVGSYSYTWGGNVFTASENENLEAVSFYTPVENSSYTLKYYTGVTSNPTSGTLAGTQTGTIDFAGYHTVPLDAPIALAAGQKFSVVLNLTTPGYSYPMAVEYPYTTYSSKASAASGQSYLGFNGTAWNEATGVKTGMNVCIKAFTSSGPTVPDLIISSLNAPASTAPGVSVEVANTVKNQGTAPAGSFDVRFYLSANQILDDTDLLLATKSVTGLAAGSSNSYPTTVMIPADAAGSYYIIASADQDGAVAESIETNNTASDLIEIGLADLVMTALDGPVSASPGQVISVANSVENRGNISAGSFTIRFYLSPDNELDDGDTVLGYRTVASLSPLSQSSVATSLTIPSATAAGNYYVLALADANQAVEEELEDNNFLRDADTISITAATVLLPDLTLTALNAPSSGKVGRTIYITNTVSNEGEAAAASFTVRFYLSKDDTLNDQDLSIGYRTVRSLAAKAVSSASTKITLPKTVPPDIYYVIGLVDAGKTVSEGNEDNNTRVDDNPGTIQITR